MKGKSLWAAWLLVVIIVGCSTGTKPVGAGERPYSGAFQRSGTRLDPEAAKTDYRRENPASVLSNNFLPAAPLQLVQPTSVWTTDGNGNIKTAFDPLDSITWKGNITNVTGGPQTAWFVWSLNGPYGARSLYSGNLKTGSGTYTWGLSGQIASDCGGTYTFILRVTFNGFTYSNSTTYSVASPPVCT